MKTNKLKPYKFNEELFDSLHKEDYDALKKDIQKNGIKTELHVTKSNIVLCGHQRLKIAKEIGLKEVPVKIIDINESDESKVKEYVILDNVLRRHLSTEQKYLLIAELSKVYEVGRGTFGKGRPNLEKDNLSSSNDVLEKTAKAVGVNEKTVQRARAYEKVIQESPELRKEKVSRALAITKKRKEVEKIKEEIKETKDNEYELFCGDCIKELDKVKDNSIACLIIDPPYGIDYQSNYKILKHNKIDKDNQEVYDLLDKSLAKVKPKMKKDSHVYIFTTWKVFEKIKPIVAKHFHVKNCLIWNKNNWSMGDLDGNYAEKYEMIIFASQGRRTLQNGRPTNVLDFARTSNLNHPTEKPVDLIKELIKNSTIKGETIMDYFAGSGSTLVAAKQLGRKFIGIESDEDYFRIIKKRLI